MITILRTILLIGAPVVLPLFIFADLGNAAAPGGQMHIVVAQKSNLQVGDGDTVFYTFSKEDGVFDPRTGEVHSGKLRLLGFDTPETKNPGLGTFYDGVCGPEATEELKQLLFTEAKSVEIHTRMQFDQYGRLLAHLVIEQKNGKKVPLAVVMIERGLAFESIYAFGDNGFPEYYQLIDRAWKASATYGAISSRSVPTYLSPYLWRKINQRRDMIVEGFDSWTPAQQNEWMEKNLAAYAQRAKSAAEATRLDLVREARSNPNRKQSKEILYFLDQVYSQLPERCPIRK